MSVEGPSAVAPDAEGVLEEGPPAVVLGAGGAVVAGASVEVLDGAFLLPEAEGAFGSGGATESGTASTISSATQSSSELSEV